MCTIEVCDIGITINAQQVEREKELEAVYAVRKRDENTVSMLQNYG